MGPDAAWLAVRSAVRRTSVGAVVVALLLGVVGGIAASVLWAADRVETSYERLVRDVDAPDLILACDDPCAGPESAVERLRAEPAIASAAVVEQQFVSIQTDSGEFLGQEPTDECATGAGELELTPSDFSLDRTPPARIVTGRLPDPTSTNQVTLSAITARRAGVEVGDTVFLMGGCGDGDVSLRGAPRALEVVGIAVGFLDVRPPGQFEFVENAYVSSALIEQTGFESQTGLVAWLRPGASSTDLSPQASAAIAFDVAAHSRDVSEDLVADASALRLFAIATIVSAIAVLGQLLWSAIRAAVSVNRPLMLVGARRRDLSQLGFIHGALIGVVAAVVACVVAVAAAPIVPLGAADPIEAGADIGLVGGVGLLAAAGTLAAVLLLAVGPAVLATRRSDRPTDARAGRWPSRVADALHFGPAESLGVRFALERSEGPRPAPIRSGIGAIAVALAVVSGVITFVSGLEHLRSTPRLVGWNWDFFLWADGTDADDLARTISERSDVERSGPGIVFSWGVSLADDVTDSNAYEAIMGFDAGPNSVGPVVLEGRAPEGPDELLVAPGLAASRGLAVGDVTSLYGLNALSIVAAELGVSGDALGIEEVGGRPFEVVGIGVIPVFDGRLDAGAALTLDGFARVLPSPSRSDLVRVYESADPALLHSRLLEEGPVELTQSERRQLVDAGPEGSAAVLASWSDEQIARVTPQFDGAQPQVVFVDAAPGIGPRSLLQKMADDGVVDQSFVDEVFDRGGGELSPEQLVKLDLGDVDWIPASFGYLMGATALAALAYVVTSAARERRDALATLRALGLSTGQVRRTIAWQSAVTVGVAMTVALPIGTIGGRIAWDRYATGLQVVPEPVTPWRYLGVFVVTVFAVALLVSVVPGWRAARRSPIESLRSE
jgi:hypothetical protein